MNKQPIDNPNPEMPEKSLWRKLKRFARQAGLKTVYTVLLLFYAFKRKETPIWAKNIILGTLAYFISPIDALPDLTPVLGYTDDLGVLSFGLVTIACFVNEEVRANARARLDNWFTNYDEAALAEVDKKL